METNEYEIVYKYTNKLHESLISISKLNHFLLNQNNPKSISSNFVCIFEFMRDFTKQLFFFSYHFQKLTVSIVVS